MEIVIIGFALYSGVEIMLLVWRLGADWHPSGRILVICFTAASVFYIVGFCLIFIVGFIRLVFRLRLKEGVYSIFSLEAVKWAISNSLQRLVANTFLNAILMTPFANFVYRMLGAKIGKNVQINSSYCSDYSLLEVGDNTTIGGHSTVIAHSFERGRIILKKVVIGKNVTIGLNSVILPGTIIGDHAVVAAGTVVLKNENIRSRSVVFGVPAQTTQERRREKE